MTADTEARKDSLPRLHYAEWTKDELAEARAKRRDAPLPLSGRMVGFPAKLNIELVERNGKQFYNVTGYATTFNQPYQMYDMFGPYTETVANTALDNSLTSNPDVAFLVNHRGVTMARTTNETLKLGKDVQGLTVEALLNASREDVKTLMSAITDELIDQMSFAFMLEDGKWNDEYDEFTILQANIDRGDVSAVNYGANPYTSIFARAKEWMDVLPDMPDTVKRAAYATLSGTETALRAREDAYRALADMDPDDKVSALVAAVDAALDEATSLTAAFDTATLPPEVGQAIGLLTAAETAADELMELLGINDPDDPAGSDEPATALAKEQSESKPAAQPLSRSVALYRNRLMLEEQN